MSYPMCKPSTLLLINEPILLRDLVPFVVPKTHGRPTFCHDTPIVNRILGSAGLHTLAHCAIDVTIVGSSMSRTATGLKVHSLPAKSED